MLKRVRRYLQRFRSVHWCREVIVAVRDVGRKFRGGGVSLRTNGTAKGNVLVSYNNEGFLCQMRGEAVPTNHPSYYKTIVIAKTFIDGSRLGTGRDAMNTMWSQNPVVPAPTSSVFDSTAVRTWVLLTSGG